MKISKLMNFATQILTGTVLLAILLSSAGFVQERTDKDKKQDAKDEAA